MQNLSIVAFYVDHFQLNVTHEGEPRCVFSLCHTVCLLPRLVVRVAAAAASLSQGAISISQWQMIPVCHSRNERPSVLFDRCHGSVRLNLFNVWRAIVTPFCSDKLRKKELLAPGH